MRITGIHADRFGAFQNASLTDLAPGLTVVLGPNESGKSTYAALVHAVLYGYPNSRAAGTKLYRPADGSKRLGRLVMEEDGSRWSIKRDDGAKRGAVTITTLAGADRPMLRDEVVSGVSEDTFSTVFGFGLDELEDIASGSNEQVMSRLFAGESGLDVNPLDVQKSLEAAAADRFAPLKRTSRLYVIDAEITQVRAEISELETAANEYAAEAVKVTALAEQLEPLAARHAQAVAHVAGLRRDLEHLRLATERHGVAGLAVAQAESGILDLEARIAAIVLDERVLAVASELDAVLEGTSGFARELDEIKVVERHIVDLDARIGAYADLTAGIEDAADARSRIEQWRTKRATLDAELSASVAETERATAAFEGYTRAHEAGTPGSSAGSHAGVRVISWALVALGVAGAVAGIVLGQYLAAGIGAVVGVLALILAWLYRSHSSGAGDLSADVRRLGAEAHAARGRADAVAARSREADAEWVAWLAAEGLGSAGDAPGAVLALLDRARDRIDLVAQRERASVDARNRRDAATSWLTGLATLVAPFLGPLQGGLESGSVLAARARDALAQARQLRATLDQLETERGALDRELKRARADADEAAGVIAALSAARALDGVAPVAQLEALVSRVDSESQELRAQYEALRREHDELVGKLDTRGRDAAMARARQRLEGLRAQANDAAREHLEYAMAARLIAKTRERFDRERKPAVWKVASRVFSAMTGGRYTDALSAPDTHAVTVVTSDDKTRTPDLLSRGTAEQLYLAVRVGLIATQGEIGKHLPILMDDVMVNFDEERRSSAAIAVAELAALRQVIYFTCDPDTAAVLQGAVADSRLIEMGRCPIG